MNEFEKSSAEWKTAMDAVVAIMKHHKFTREEMTAINDAMAKALFYGAHGAIHHNKEIVVARAANGRRLIGATTRQKVKEKAQDYRNWTKETASVEIADALGMSAGTVRRYLTQLFPGSEWKQ